MQHDVVVPVATIVATLWDEPIPDHAEHTLQQHVSSLRKALAPDRDGAPPLLATKEPGYVLHVDVLDTDEHEHDVATATTAAARARPRAPRSWRSTAPPPGSAAQPLSDVRSSLRLEAAATRLQERIDDAEAARIDVMLALGMHREAIPQIEHLVERQPYREALRAPSSCSPSTGRTGRPTRLRTFRATRALLVEELGVEPSRSLRELEDAILRQDPAPRSRNGARRHTWPVRCAADEHSEFGCIELPDGQVIALGSSAVIGRAPDAAIRLVDSRVSREHARIEHDGSGPRIVDLGSTNGDDGERDPHPRARTRRR